MTTIY